jgi:hypothetical protein
MTTLTMANGFFAIGPNLKLLEGKTYALSDDQLAARLLTPHVLHGRAAARPPLPYEHPDNTDTRP